MADSLLARAREWIGARAFVMTDMGVRCGTCYARIPEGHTPDCPTAALLAELDRAIAASATLDDALSRWDGWECEKSPTGHCVYASNNFDSCDYCGQPEERK